MCRKKYVMLFLCLFLISFSLSACMTAGARLFSLHEASKWESMFCIRGKLSFAIDVSRKDGRKVQMEAEEVLCHIRKQDAAVVQMSMDGPVSVRCGEQKFSSNISLRRSGAEGCVSTDNGAWETIAFTKEKESFFDVLSDFSFLSRRENADQPVNGCKAICVTGMLSEQQADALLRLFVPDADCPGLQIECRYFFEEGTGIPLALELGSDSSELSVRLDFDRYNFDADDASFVLYAGYPTGDSTYASVFSVLYDVAGVSNDFDPSADLKSSYGTDDMIGDTMTVREGKKETFTVGFRGYRSLSQVELLEDPVRLSVSGNDSSLYSYAYLSDKLSLNLYDTVYSDQDVAVSYYKDRENHGDIRGRRVSKVSSFIWQGHPVYAYSYEYIYTDADSRKEFSQNSYLYYVGLGQTYVVICVESQVNAGDAVILTSAVAEDVLNHYVVVPVE